MQLREVGLGVGAGILGGVSGGRVRQSLGRGGQHQLLDMLGVDLDFLDLFSNRKREIAVLAGDRLVVAGPPDLTEKDPALLAYQNEQESLAGFRGERGVSLRVVSAGDGATLSEAKLPTMPVFDGMSAADGKLYIALRDGTVQCWGK